MSRFDWALTTAAHSQPPSNLVHHPWRTGNEEGNQRKIDKFLARSKRRKNPVWGSDTSTIYTEATGSSQSSSQSSFASILRKIEEPCPSTAPTNRTTIQLPTNPPNHDQNREPRNTISAQVVGSGKPPQHQRSYSENSNRLSHGAPPRFERGVYRCDTDFDAPLPPRGPRVSPGPPTIATRKTISSEQEHTQRPRAPEQVKGALGPIDVDTLETYSREKNGSVDSLDMMEIEDPSDEAGGSSRPADPPKPGMAIRQGTCDSFAYSASTSEGVEEEYEEEYHNDEDVPLNPLTKLEKKDALADDDEEDYKYIRAYMKRFPILDEREAERILCGYCRGFEPEQDEEDEDDLDRRGAFEI